MQLFRKFGITAAVLILAASLGACAGKKEETEKDSIWEPIGGSEKESPGESGESTGSGESSDSAGKGNAGEAGGAEEAAAQDGAFSYKDITGREFYFSSGAGGWASVLHVQEDGSFDCFYHDSEMGSIGEGYPNGTLYYSEAEGKFGTPEKISDYVWKLPIASVEYPLGDGEEIKDDIRYLYTTAYGIDGTDELLLYLPGMPVEELPEGYISWMDPMDRQAVQDGTMKVLEEYGLYNEPEGNGFVSYPAAEDASAEENSAGADTAGADTAGADADVSALLKECEDRDLEFQEKLKQDMSQLELNFTAEDHYRLWDDALNRIWGMLKQRLDADTMKNLTEEQVAWIERKEKVVQEAGAEYEGGSIQPLIMHEKAAEITRERVYELAELLR